MIKPSFLFTDHAVLQWGKEIPIWGECDGNALTVTYFDHTVEACVENGHFTATLPAMPAKFSGDLIFESAKESLFFHDVVTGDVYLAGGQSNMEHPLFCSYYDEEDLESDNGIRLFTVPRRPYEGADVRGWHFYATRSEDTPWTPYTEQSAMGFSAVASYFAKRLRRDVDIPIGVIACNWGATSAEAWIDRDRLLQTKMARWAIESYEAKFKDLDPVRYHEDFEDFQRELLEYIKEHDAMEEAKLHGADFVLRNFFTRTIKEGPYHYKTPCAYRNTMLSRVTPFAICGVIWYQGESNTYSDNPHPAKAYFREVMDTLIADWRDAFRDPALPFYIVQISTYPRGSKKDAGTEWCDIRAVHEELGREPNVYTVVSADVGERDNIHPANKKPVGARLALAALATRYQKDVAWRSPTVRDVKIKDGEIVIFFDHAKILRAKGGCARGFFVTDRDGETVEVDVTLAKNTARIPYSENVAAVGFCNRNYAVVNVYSENDLPPFPFEYKL